MLRFVTSYWGSRVSVMLGGVLSATGLALCMMVQELYQLYLAFGLLVGEFRSVCLSKNCYVLPLDCLLVSSGVFDCPKTVTCCLWIACG